MQVYNFPSGASSLLSHPKAFLALAVCGLLTSFTSTLMFTAMGSFFNRISDPGMGGAYLTLLNTIANMGRTHTYTHFHMCWTSHFLDGHQCMRGCILSHTLKHSDKHCTAHSRRLVQLSSYLTLFSYRVSQDAAMNVLPPCLTDLYVGINKSFFPFFKGSQRVRHLICTAHQAVYILVNIISAANITAYY